MYTHEIFEKLIGDIQSSPVTYYGFSIRDGIMKKTEHDFPYAKLKSFPTTKQAIEAFTENLMMLICNMPADIDEIIINPTITLLAPESIRGDIDGKKFDETIEISDNVLIDFFDCYAKKNDEKITINSTNISGYKCNYFYVSFKEFVIGLSEVGFEIINPTTSEPLTFEDLKTNSKNGIVTISYSPQKEKKRRFSNPTPSE